MNPTKISIVSCLFFLFFSCGTYKAPYYSDSAKTQIDNDNNISSTLKHSVYLVGDAGELDDPIKKRNFVLDQVSHSIKEEGKETSVVYLGDNLYLKDWSKKMILTDNEVKTF
ncbi:MAG: hypothetical protein HKN67_01995 [Saprospiraceae bacterium]|nr:hypothetical protein [Saprospiraceae bacterium]